MKHFLTLLDIDRPALSRILERASRLKQGEKSRVLSEKTFGLLFEKPSTRTRISFEVGVVQLGGHPVILNSKEIQLSRGESLRDSAEVFSRFLDGIMVRTFAHSTLETLAQFGSIPVVNGLSDLYHPCQALADFQTILENGIQPEKSHLVYIGDGNNNVTHSLMLASAMLGMKMSVLCPKEYAPLPKVLARAKELGGRIEVHHEVSESVLASADVLYADVWVSMGQESVREQKLATLEPFQLNAELIQKARKDPIIMHCLPAHVGEEITEDVLYSPRSVIFDQAENRLHAQKSLLIEIYS